MPHFVLSPQATERLKQISLYTLENYGEQQRKKYLGLLREAMQTVAKNPEKGKERPEIKAGYYSISAGRHHIYYRVRDDHIEVIDVLHQSMEPLLHLG